MTWGSLKGPDQLSDFPLFSKNLLHTYVQDLLGDIPGDREAGATTFGNKKLTTYLGEKAAHETSLWLKNIDL